MTEPGESVTVFCPILRAVHQHLPVLTVPGHAKVN